jgi:hypothetical protein
MWRFLIVLECCTRNTEMLQYFSVPFSTVVKTDIERFPKVQTLWLVFASLKPLAIIQSSML